MSFEILRIALFKPAESEPIQVAKIFPSDRYSIRIVDDPEEIRSLIEEEGSPFDAILVPVQVADTRGSESLCIQLRANNETAVTPIIAIGQQITSGDLASLLDAGADLVLTLSRDQDIIYAQILAQVKIIQRCSVAQKRSLEAVGLQQSTIRVLNLMREGILLFDPSRKLTFINSSAGRLLGIDWVTPQEIVDETIAALIPLLESHIEACAAIPLEESNALPLSISKLSINRADNRSFPGSVRLVSIPGHTSEIVGYALSLVDLSEFDVLSQNILQGHRMRTLGLLSAAACSHLSQGKKFGNSPSAIFTELHGLLPLRSSCTSTLTVVLEYLDLVLSPSTAINLQASSEFIVAVKFDDLFQLIGLAIMEANDYTSNGDISVGFSELDTNKILLRVAGHSTRSVPFATSDDFTALLQGCFDPSDDPSKQLSSSWRSAEAIAARYNATIRKKSPDQLSIEIEIELPR